MPPADVASLYLCPITPLDRIANLFVGFPPPHCKHSRTRVSNPLNNSFLIKINPITSPYGFFLKKDSIIHFHGSSSLSSCLTESVRLLLHNLFFFITIIIIMTTTRLSNDRQVLSIHPFSYCESHFGSRAKKKRKKTIITVTIIMIVSGSLHLSAAPRLSHQPVHISRAIMCSSCTSIFNFSFYFFFFFAQVDSHSATPLVIIT